MRPRQLLSVLLLAIAAPLKAQALPVVQTGAGSLERAEALLREGRREEAINAVNGYVRQHPNDVQGYILLGRSYAENSQIPRSA